jgi:phosphoribosylamine--glycine ligase
MQRHGIPTARYATFTDAAAAHAYVDAAGRADRHQGRRPGGRQGRGGGDDAAEAHEAIDDMLGDNKLACSTTPAARAW